MCSHVRQVAPGGVPNQELLKEFSQRGRVHHGYILKLLKEHLWKKRSISVIYIGMSSHLIDPVFLAYVCQMAAGHFLCVALTPIQNLDEDSSVVNSNLVCLSYTDIYL